MDDRSRLFDEWASSYDPAADGDKHPFPFDGYEGVSRLVCQRADCMPGHTVLDVGIGNGNLARRLAALGCQVWGVDFSPAMLALATAPGIRVFQADVLREWPRELLRRFDRIVSGYVFHEFNLDEKLVLLKRLAGHHLASAGRIVIGDISFASARDREEAHGRWRDRWDEAEHYWAADEAIAAGARLGLALRYDQVSSCGGVYVVTPTE